MASLPDYLTEQTEEAIRQRMLDSLPADLDKTEGSYIWDALSPAAIELALAAVWGQEVLRRGFAGTTFGAYLDLRCEEHGLARKPAVKASGQVQFTGAVGTVVAAGVRVATAADAATGEPSIEFVTTAAGVLGADGHATVPVAAVEAGKRGNVAAGAIVLPVSPLGGITAVSNAAATAGGADIEDDATLLARYLQRVRSPSAGGNKADYVNWTLEVAGVGGVSVIPVEDGPGTVNVYVIDAAKAPAGQAIVDAVQAYIAPPHRLLDENGALTAGGYGISTDTTQADATDGSTLKLVYSASGAGTAKRSAMDGRLLQPGIWRVMPLVKVNSTAGTGTLLDIGVWNVSSGAWCRTTASGTTDARLTLTAAQLQTTFAPASVAFYWNGSDQLELRLTRLVTDTATIVWIDNVAYVSAFSRDDGAGRAPIGAKVSVRPAEAVMINVAATLAILPGYNAASVRNAAALSIGSYIKSLAFMDNNDVVYTRIGQAILDTTGVQDYSALTVNGGTGNVAVAAKEVAVPGTVSFA